MRDGYNKSKSTLINQITDQKNLTFSLYPNLNHVTKPIVTKQNKLLHTAISFKKICISVNANGVG